MDVTLLIGCVLAFLAGGIPFAYLIVRACKGVDLRTVGSGNVGATNASRAFTGRGARLAAFLVIYLLDAGKGFWASSWLPRQFGLELFPPGPPWLLAALFGASAILGHVFTPFLRFKGGKGVATACGVWLALDWQVLIAALAAFFVVRLLTHQVFFGSIALGLTLGAAAVAFHPTDAFHERLPVTILALVLAVFLIWTHRSNLRKYLLARREALS
jgi:glycerol-3-phosphate acyltransferase PlsY